MSSVKPEPGMTYDFDVDDFFYLSSGMLAFSGFPSVEYQTYIPAKADIYVDGEMMGSIHLTQQPHFKRLDLSLPQKIGLETRDKIDLMPFKGRSIKLKCLFE